MPIKDIEILGGTLYLNNDPIMTLGKYEIVEPEAQDFSVEEPKDLKLDWLKKEMTFTVENVQIKRNLLLSLLHGRKVTNNWLKQHGGVMTRKKGRNK